MLEHSFCFPGRKTLFFQGLEWVCRQLSFSFCNSRRASPAKSEAAISYKTKPHTEQNGGSSRNRPGPASCFWDGSLLLGTGFHRDAVNMHLWGQPATPAAQAGLPSALALASVSHLRLLGPCSKLAKPNRPPLPARRPQSLGKRRRPWGPGRALTHPSPGSALKGFRLGFGFCFVFVFLFLGFFLPF